jgi:hypothetical protein
MTVDRDDTAWIHPTTVFAGRAWVGFCSRIGHGAPTNEPVRVADGVQLHHRWRARGSNGCRGQRYVSG